MCSWCVLLYLQGEREERGGKEATSDEEMTSQLPARLIPPSQVVSATAQTATVQHISASAPYRAPALTPVAQPASSTTSTSMAFPSAPGAAPPSAARQPSLPSSPPPPPGVPAPTQQLSAVGEEDLALDLPRVVADEDDDDDVDMAVDTDRERTRYDKEEEEEEQQQHLQLQQQQQQRGDAEYERARSQASEREAQEAMLRKLREEEERRRYEERAAREEARRQQRTSLQRERAVPSRAASLYDAPEPGMWKPFDPTLTAGKARSETKLDDDGAASGEYVALDTTVSSRYQPLDATAPAVPTPPRSEYTPLDARSMDYTPLDAGVTVPTSGPTPPLQSKDSSSHLFRVQHAASKRAIGATCEEEKLTEWRQSDPTDEVFFSAFAPGSISRRQVFPLSLWAFLRHQVCRLPVCIAIMRRNEMTLTSCMVASVVV